MNTVPPVPLRLGRAMRRENEVGSENSEKQPAVSVGKQANGKSGLKTVLCQPND